MNSQNKIHTNVWSLESVDPGLCVLEMIQKVSIQLSLLNITFYSELDASSYESEISNLNEILSRAKDIILKQPKDYFNIGVSWGELSLVSEKLEKKLGLKNELTK